MIITDFYTSPDREHWLSQLRLCDWRAGPYLCYLIDSGKFYETLGDSSKLLLLTENEKLLSFCALTETDQVDTPLTPWIGFVYTYPEARGRRLMGILIEEAKKIAADRGFDTVYLTTDHIGLYEKYGFEFVGMMKERSGEDTRIYKIKTR
ncbi:MAG: GNAT family N-acetyltransferase [Ruminococcus sp.]|nr:GNAT family N-acetyltransferase [Ruminococcus sp.]